MSGREDRPDPPAAPDRLPPWAAGGRRVSRRALLGGGLAVGASATATGAVLLDRALRKETAPFAPVLGADGLVTNEYAFRHPHATDARRSPDWVVTSGSLFASKGEGRTGAPDAGPTGPDSARATDSAVFRLVSRRRDFGSVSVSTWVRLRPPVTTPRTPARDWDGGHLWLRYHSPEELYAFSFRRRDGAVVIKRKVPAHDARAVDGGDYATLAESRHAFAYDSWHQVTASAVNLFGGVRLQLRIDERTVLSHDDRTPGPLVLPGGVGIRADNTELSFRDFRATPQA
ncbi:hypothetical protein [Streptomyces sp. Ag109_G2-15]|uniref:hypothetical protein n=1 Tax=Streptomyces sp. Ag109_G2-15 TaxID=1938850 RepID=UPI000BC51DF8|nr:hypothetical protein [Streptomyces sp. Ag109_G2-15]SOD86731.1 hypothetical protein SAMN06272765_4201 [Streptomyces sp. Ag109_G2-15]